MPKEVHLLKGIPPIPNCSCPRCWISLRPGDPLCANCGFSFEEVDRMYGGDDVRLDRLMDAAHCLTVDGKRTVEASLDRFERRFPQLFAAVYLDTLPTRTRIEEFSFWLLNRAAVQGIGPTRPNDNGILLCVDLNTRQVAVATGYLPERLIPRKSLRRALQATRSCLAAGDHDEAILLFLRKIDHALRKAAIRLSKTTAGVLGSGTSQSLPTSLQQVRGHAPTTPREVGEHHSTPSEDR